MNKGFFVFGVLVLSVVLVSGCGQKESVETQKVKESAEVQKVEVPAPIVTPAPEVVEQPIEVPKVEVKPEVKDLVVADFNSGSKPNNIDGDFGAWNKDPDDKTQWCSETFNADEKYGKEGFALEINYDVDSPNPAYNGFWMKLQNTDATPYNKLVFYIKGDEKIGYPQKLKIELKNAKGEVGKTYITQISPTWAPVEIPFSSFQGIKDFSNMTELSIVFEDSVSRPKTGRIYIDNIGFAKD